MTLDAAQRRVVLEDLAHRLEAKFLHPQTGARYAAMRRRRITDGAYDKLSDPAAFGEKVTADLQAVAPDGHLRLAPEAAFSQPRAPAADAPASTRPSGPPGLEVAEMIGQVAYLRFNLSPDEPKTADDARAFLVAHADAQAVILDMRPNRGGGLRVMDAILPLFYEHKTLLLRLDARATDGGGSPPSGNLIRRRGPSSIVRRDHVITPDAAETRLRQTPIYYLTSHGTASAAEHMALALKRTHRATLIGETTRGAGHFGMLVPISAGFAAFVPFGRTYDPDTGKD